MIREDLKLTENQLRLYSNINYYDRYKKLSQSFRKKEDALQEINNDKVIQIIENKGYKVRYNSKESFFKINENINEHNFYFHVSLKRGLVEFIFGLLRKSDESGMKIGDQIGGTISRTCKLIEINKGIESNGYIEYPVFSDYNELKEILQEGLSLFEDLKSETIKIYN